MPCALEVFDTRVQSTSHIQCNRSFDQNIGRHFSKGRLICKPVSVHPGNRDTALTVLPLGHDSDWKPAPFFSGIQEVNKVISLTSGDLGTEGLELLSAQPILPCCLGQLNERNMHDQADSSKPVSNGNPHRGSTLSQSQQRKTISSSSVAVPPCHVVAKKFPRPVATILRPDSDILHDDDKPSKRSYKKKGNKKGKQYGRTTRKKLNLASESTFEENTYGVSPTEVLPTNLLVDKLSEITSSASLLVKKAHLGGENNNDSVKCGTMLNLSTLGTDEMDGSECAGSSNDAVGGRLSCTCVPYLNDESNTTDSSDFDRSTFMEHGLGEESKSCQKFPCAYVYNPDYATTDSFFGKWSNDNSGNYCVNVEARLTLNDENSLDHSQPVASTGLNDVSKCQLIRPHLSATHTEGTNYPLESRSCSSKDVTDSCSHTERVLCSSEACSSKDSLQICSGSRNRRSRKTTSYSDLTASNRVIGANRNKNNGKNSLSVWQKVERNDKIISKAGHSSNPPIQQKSAHEDSNKGVQEDTTRNRAKHNQNRKACKHESPNGTLELESTKEEQDALGSCQTFSKLIYKKQAPFLRSSSSKQGSQSSKNYYAPRNSIPKVPKDSLQQEALPTLQLVQANDIGGRSTSNSCSADKVVQTGDSSNYPTEGNKSSQSSIDVAASVSSNLFPDLTLRAASDGAHISDPYSLCPQDKGTYTSWSSKNSFTDRCTAETEEARSVKLTTENNSQESCQWYSAAGHLSQKWVPVGKKEASNVIHLDVSEASVVKGIVPANDISDSVGPVSTNGGDSKLASEMTSKLSSSEHADLKRQAYDGIETGYNKIKEAISYVFTAQRRAEDIQHRIGRLLADFEHFVSSASPVVHRNPCPAGCKFYLQESVEDGLCFHQTPDITLRTVWRWYEEPGCYGLEVKAQDFRRSKGLGNSHCQFTTYFVPYLSAVQLFKQTKRTGGGSIVKETMDGDMTCETSPHLSFKKEETSPHQNLPPIFAKLLPQQSNPINRSSSFHNEDDRQLVNGELIFEFFESEQPYSRRQLFDKYCVAWYPIYRIPDGKLQAAFLTYHSLGHWIGRISSADEAVILPVIGLQSYNDKAERWFEMSKPGSEAGGPPEDGQCGEAPQVLKQRVRALNDAAAVMSRANVAKSGQMTRNRHPDYEFFLSRYR
ncbi:hypothetical protein GQ55_4G003700 [Panicum hallii var. hallii]|uniref:Uncharacterized protein n=1 Tax=Panicum hallii var. hallii TaxID=1504633 RepID=A0A2T7DTP8_9POAL|nr:hypothetical protein GQ55_4G003700 [Panicum hallii var. hallii]